MKKLLRSILLAVLILSTVASLVACGNKQEEQTESTTDPQTSIGDASKLFDVSEEFPASYLQSAAIVYDKDGASNIITELVITLRSYIQEKYGVKLSIYDDDSVKDAQHLIIVGVTSLSNSLEVQRGLRANDYAYGVKGNDLLIIGGTADKTATVLEAYLSVLSGLSGDEPLLRNDSAFLMYGTYKYDCVSLNGKELCEYTIVYPQNGSERESIIAEWIADKFQAENGYVLRCTDDSAAATDNEIRIGKTNRASSSLPTLSDDSAEYIIGDEKSVTIWGASFSSMISSAKYLLEDYFVDDTQKSINVVVDGEKIYKQSAMIKTLVYNIYNESGEPGDQDLETRPYRQQMILDTVNEVHPDVFMTQETTAWWMFYLKANLPEEYAWAETVSNGQTNDISYMAIFYDTNTLELVDNGMFWPSNTPDIYSTFPDPWSTRIVTWAKFKQKSSGKEFMCVNLHLDGALTCNTPQAEVVLEFLKQYEDIPIIFGGDFNRKKTDSSRDEKTPYQIFSDYSRTVDAQSCAYIASANAEIDFTFVTPDGMEVVEYSSFDGKMENGIEASDHDPQLTTFFLK